MKSFRFVYLFLITLLALSSSAQSKEKNVFPKGAKYGFWGELKSGGNTPKCSDSKNGEICIQNDAEWKKLCQSAKGATSGSFKVQASARYGKEKILLQGGSIDSIDISWGKSGSGFEACYVIVNASGMVDGNSTKAEIQGIARSFIVNDKGELLVESWGLF